MATPNSTSYDRPDIGQSVVEFDVAAAEAGLIGLEVAPPFNAAEQSGTFPRVPLEATLEELETKRNSKGGYAESDWEFEQDSFATVEHGAVERIDDRQAAIYAYALDYEVICAKRARWKVLAKLEREIKTAAEAAGSSAAVTVPWSQAQTADPVADVLTAVDSFKAASGYLPNAAWLTDKCVRKLALCAAIRDQVKFSGLDDPKLMTDPAKRGPFLRALADLFGLPKLMVASAVRNTANKNQTFSLSQIWTDATFGLIKVASSADLEEPCALRTFVWDGDGAGVGGTFETFRDEGKRSDMMRFRHERQVKTIHSQLVYRLTGVI